MYRMVCISTGLITETVLFYIKNYAKNITVDKHIQVLLNQTGWMTSTVCSHKVHNTAFRLADRALYSIAKTNLRRGIEMPKRHISLQLIKT